MSATLAPSRAAVRRRRSASEFERGSMGRRYRPRSRAASAGVRGCARRLPRGTVGAIAGPYQEASMPRFLIEATYTAQGVAGIKSTGGSARRDAIVQLAKSVGGRMETFDFAFGRSDVVTICELPDNAAAAAVALAVNGSGAVSIRTTV